MAGQPLTDADKAYIRAAHARHESHRQIAAHLGRARGTVAHFMKREGLTYDSTKQQAANARKHADAVARRLDAHHNALTILELEQEHYLGLLRGQTPFKMLVKAVGGAEETRQLDYIPGNERRAHNQALSAAIINVTKLAPAETGATEKAVSLVDQLMGSFKDANAANKARQEQAEDEPQ